MKKPLSILISIVVFLSCLTGMDFSAYSLSSGYCGNDVRYSFNSLTGKLTISGTGEMTNYSWDMSPFSYNTEIKSVVINYGVTSIGNYLFGGCSGITSVSVPNSIVSIGSEAFEDCESLKSITIPNSTNIIDSFAFSGCIELESVVIGRGVSSIGANAFHRCVSISSIIVDDSNKYYDSRDGCNSIIKKSTNELIYGCKSSFIPNSVCSIGDSAFEGCKGLKSIIIPNSVTNIAIEAFSQCSGLTNITIPSSVNTIGDGAFSSCDGLENIVITNGVVNIEDGAFAQCTNLKSLTIPRSVKNIGSSVLEECNNIESIFVDKNNPNYDSRNNCNAVIKTSTNTLILGCKTTIIPNDVEKIDSFAFIDNKGLTNISIPNSVISIGVAAFYGCTGLTSINVPNNVKSIENDAFHYVNNVHYAGSATGKPWGAKCINGYVEGKLVYENSKKLKLCGCSSTYSDEVIIPNSVTDIGVAAFIDCENITKVLISNGVKNIDDYAFENCAKLENVVLPDGLIYIGNYVFYNCKRLITATIPNSVVSIGNDPFIDCDDLKGIYYLGTETQWNNISLKSFIIPYATEIYYHVYHSFIVKDYRESTCIEQGFRLISCECGYERKDLFPLIDHMPSDVVIENRISATCKSDGSYDELVYCVSCNQELSRETKIIKASHQYKLEEYIEPDCENDGLTFLVCNECGNEIIEEPKALGHDVVTDSYVSPTCEGTGLTEGSHCSRCNKIFVEQTIIPAKGHVNELYRTTTTCTKNGFDIYKCLICSETTSVRTYAFGHDCRRFIRSNKNILTYSCSKCNSEYDEYVDDILVSWNMTIFNGSADECPAVNVVNDGIINAKDYAKLKHIQKYGE